MVCGKCQHGIYRTFMSPCHMRMFQCNNNDEKLELMSRYPCVLSAPYSHPVNEQVSEPNDVDDIQRFIYCREAYELGSKTIIDPRCSDFDMGKYFVEDQN
ncbi:unnamed protein product [Diatraea saccharalis]|uniref:Uncharacterized protein n=1 Tax=Diatraea saccharalis TaxID=40085 RepID=A0A9N9R6M5_9NEOP|nr:unnamed protein product [Diatraea saccharalis]